MEGLLTNLILYVMLCIASLQQLTCADVTQLPKDSVNSSLSLQGDQVTKDLTCLESVYNDLFRKSASPTKKEGALRDLVSCLGKTNKNTEYKKKSGDGPVFLQDIYSVSLLETSDINSMILQVEATDPSTSLIKYSLWGKNNDYFHIDSLNGGITLVKPLEYNKINKYDLTAKASDIKGHSSSVPVLIEIQDMDTMNPHFIYPLYEASISENQKGVLSTKPEEIEAVDGDNGINEPVTYSISDVYPEEYRNAVSIDKSGGVLSLTRDIDRELVSLITVYIKAAQKDNYLKTADSVVMINILDENDNPPQFSKSIYETSVLENVPPGAEILVVTVTDKDGEGQTSHHFTTNNTMFSVDNYGVMHLVHGELDRELTPQVFVKIWVFDAESDRLNSSAVVIINLMDINDNNPEFQNLPLLFSVPEGEYTMLVPVGEVIVTDRDAGINGQVTVSSVNGNKMFIIHQNGTILVTGSLDRETKDKYAISLAASDKGEPPRKSFADLVIVIKDVNDNAPSFTQPRYSAHLMFTTMKICKPILAVSATDSDFGNNSQISYRFAEHQNTFSINKHTGVISLASNIPTTKDVDMSLTVLAMDHGSPALTSTATVSITVNQGSPMFVNSSYSFSVTEGLPPGAEVGTVNARTGPNVSVMYFLGTYTEVFSITDKGTILTSTMLDREEQDSYRVLVKTLDSWEPPNTGAVVITVTVLDRNDNAPVFSPLIHTHVTCQENKDFQDLGHISATDKDAGNNSVVTYVLENNFDGTFHIDSSAGQLTNTKKLDREKTDRYDLTVIARDLGSPPLSSSIIIHVSVMDADDNPPVFGNLLYEVTVKENEPPHVILSVSAADMDTAANALILYSITDVSHLFHIGEISGHITNLQPLDFESSAEHVMNVTAYNPRNPQFQSTATVTVHVEDVKEQGPTVEHGVYHTVIWDGAFTIGSVLVDINATQGNKAVDEGIQYSITGGNNEGLFAISNGTGRIFVIKDLPIHHSPLHYVLTVSCRDSEMPQLSTSVKVFVALSPSNFGYPVFSSDFYCPEPLNDWTAPNTVVTQIKAFYLPGKLVYSIADDKDYFTIDPITGIIKTRKSLVMRDFPRNITVKARDSQRRWIHSEAIVLVTVIHGNQYAPVFPKPFMKVTVEEVQTFPLFIAQAEATDGDTGRNGVIQYSILNEGLQHFSINATNGKIFASSRFYFHNGPKEFQVFILAEDQGFPKRKQGYCTIDIQVLNTNDSKPAFLPTDDMLIEENAPVGTVVGKVTATEQDAENDALIVYSLNDADDQFEIDEKLGDILVKRPLDYETKQTYILNITASSNKTAPFYQTSTQLTVHILDVNDNAPQFTQKQYFADVSVNSPVGTLVTDVTASDRDQGENGIIEYFLLSDQSSDYFLIENVRRGRVITNGRQLEPGELHVIVFAKDRGTPSLNSTASIIINVIHKKDFSNSTENTVNSDQKKNETNSDHNDVISGKNKKIIYRIIAGNEGGQFNLNEETGQLRPTGKLNYEAQPSYIMTVEADIMPDTQDTQQVPKFEKQKYYATVLNSVPYGFPIIRVTAKEQDLKPDEKLQYSLVNQPVKEFTIDEYTGEILAKSLAGITGTFDIAVRATNPSGLYHQTSVQIKVESSSTSNDVSDIKINQTTEEVKRHIEEITKALENLLQQKIKILDLVPSGNNTDIRFQTSGKRNKDLKRKLSDQLGSIKKMMEEIFGGPVAVSAPSSHTFSFTDGAIMGPLVTILAACGFTGIAVFLHKRFKKSSNEADEETGSQTSEDSSDNNTQIFKNGDENKSNVPAEGTPEFPAVCSMAEEKVSQSDPPSPETVSIVPAVSTPESPAVCSTTEENVSQSASSSLVTTSIVPAVSTPESPAVCSTTEENVSQSASSSLVTTSGAELSINTDSSVQKTTVHPQQTVTEETIVEYVVSWEPCDSDEDAVLDPANEDKETNKVPETTDPVTADTEATESQDPEPTDPVTADREATESQDPESTDPVTADTEATESQDSETTDPVTADREATEPQDSKSIDTVNADREATEPQVPEPTNTVTADTEVPEQEKVSITATFLEEE
ncbi:protocadherin Fat 4-like [Hyperolius riggenbachi]|uniref:protocadherin Fat 4-like n=1 Tax=Hyperolius riggenbachi TaxID=752182 RepID=UPI0035A35925